jgi:hypothetical protein
MDRLATGVKPQVLGLQIGDWSKTSCFGRKMTDGQRCLNMDFAAISLNFLTPTHTHESGNHSNGYGHPTTAITRSFSGTAGNCFSSNR